MNKEYKYLDYILNPPEKIMEGQIWKAPSKGLELIVTDVISKDIVRAAIITPIKYLADENDISLKDDATAREVFGRERYVIRITDGPIPTELLSIYLGSVQNITLNKIKESLTIRNFNYDEAQQILIDTLLESLEPYREQALKLYEETASEPIMINLPFVQEYEFNNVLRLAADDLVTEMQEIEFWRKERESIYKKDLPVNIPNLILRISVVDNQYFLIIITDKIKQIDSLEITENGEEFLKVNKLIISDSNRKAIQINKKFDDQAFYTLTLSVDNKNYSINFMVDYE